MEVNTFFALGYKDDPKFKAAQKDQKAKPNDAGTQKKSSKPAKHTSTSTKDEKSRGRGATRSRGRGRK